MTTMIASELAKVPSDGLTKTMYDLRRQERQLLVQFLACLGEMERRQLHLELGFSSIFTYMTEQLGYEKATAYRRMEASPLMAAFPIIAEYLADGRLGLTAL